MPTIFPSTQKQLDALLTQDRTLPIFYWPLATPPQQNPAYTPLRTMVPKGFQFKFRELLHAIGCKLVQLPITSENDAVSAAQFYLRILDLTRSDLGLVSNIEPDFKTNRTMELGTGMACLFVWKCWSVPWDQLAPIRGPGKRYDYRCVTPSGWRGIIEAKGATSKGTQKRQVNDGLKKKRAHHKRKERHDIELIVSTLIQERSNSSITVADPPFDAPSDTFGPHSEQYFRLRNWSKILAFSGAGDLAWTYYEKAGQFVYGRPPSLQRRRWGVTWRSAELRPPDTITVGTVKYVGTWFTSPLQRGRRNHDDISAVPSHGGPSLSVFQGVRGDLFERLAKGGADGGEPIRFRAQIAESTSGYQVSVFEDGSAMAVRMGR